MIIIIGAGLSGLLTAYRLKIAGIPFKILEARERIGGRIHTVFGTKNTPVEMGATWFGAYHTHLMALLQELDVHYYEQYMEGTVFFQPFSTSPAQSMQLPSQQASYRISSGTSHLIDILYKKLDPEDVLCHQSVKAITFQNNAVIVKATDVFEPSHVVLAIPPKLWSKKIVFTPTLPDQLKHIAQHTHTWMEDSIKVAVTYAEPFWRQKQISGTLFSNTGPITEFYDHCNRGVSTFALCGFINSSFKHLSTVERRAKVVTQITTVFGRQAEEFMDYKECIWSEEADTFEVSETPLFPHQNNGHPIFGNSFYDDRLFISSAEASSEFPGYMDGAVHSGNTTAKKLIDLVQSV
ncbi:flavin monoamine oxidase family protein [Gelidibacter salicanalis]|uniref:FAD-dependent oxidoreductase n=1 Tax=Gelidibacter salicanalis TaxID=291193 RepID=A0A934KVM7_9FLAO|nr:FAD-dependent oxidoreductase [Gelidibacter salicanalis]MBJ7881673.1 FAD-dependent oxidoreductase [Gelidibacter salicanalis]